MTDHVGGFAKRRKEHLTAQLGTDHLIERPRLTRLLDEATARIILLLGPAGYGKTTLARQWLSASGRPYSWYSARESSADIAVLASDLSSLLLSSADTPHRRVHELLRSQALSTDRGIDALVSVLADYLADASSVQWLVIDDVQHLSPGGAAEAFTERLIDRTGISVLLTARRRPSWLTPRRGLYGELVEINARALAMSEAETRQVLAGRSLSGMERELTVLANGWPAVVGLAARASNTQLLSGAVRKTLFDYLATELFNALSEELQDAVRLLALPTHITAPVVTFLFGKRGERMLAELAIAGFVTDVDGIAMHPLLREFVSQRTPPDTRTRDTAERLARFLIEAELYDEAASVIASGGLNSLFDDLLAAAFRPLLRTGREETLTLWVRRAKTASTSPPVTELVEAEIALRHGHFGKATAMSRVAAAKFSALGDPLEARAHLIWARAAFLASREEEAHEILERAPTPAGSPEDVEEIAWMRFLLARELERDDAPDALAAYGRVASNDYDSHIRLLTGRGMLASSDGGVDDFLTGPRDVLDLAERTTDPLIRCAYLNRCAYLFAANARYGDALTIASAELRDLKETGLDFPTPHALLVRASAEMGERRFGSADQSIRRVLALAGDDPYIRMNAAFTQARLLLAQEAIEEAAKATSDVWARPPNRSMYGEYLATHALAQAVQGNSPAVDAALTTVAGLTNSREAVDLAFIAQAVSAHVRRVSDWERTMHLAVSRIFRDGFLDVLVTAYRCYPPLLRELANIGANAFALEALVIRAHDTPLAKQAGLSLSDAADPLACLTAREREVLALLAEGITNKEIAGKLYITEVTVKAHVRHVLEKLGARTRTEAALKGAVYRATVADGSRA